MATLLKSNERHCDRIQPYSTKVCFFFVRRTSISVGFKIASKEHPPVEFPDSKLRRTYMESTWARQDPVGLHVGPMNLVSGFRNFGNVWVGLRIMCVQVCEKCRWTRDELAKLSCSTWFGINMVIELPHSKHMCVSIVALLIPSTLNIYRVPTCYTFAGKDQGGI